MYCKLQRRRFAEKIEPTESMEVQVFLEGFGGCEGSEGDGVGGDGFGGNGFKNIRWLAGGFGG